MRSARAEGLTAAEFIQSVTEEHTRRRRFDAVRSASATWTVDQDHTELTADWDQTSNDGRAD